MCADLKENDGEDDHEEKGLTGSISRGFSYIHGSCAHIGHVKVGFVFELRDVEEHGGEGSGQPVFRIDWRRLRSECNL